MRSGFYCFYAHICARCAKPFDLIRFELIELNDFVFCIVVVVIEQMNLRRLSLLYLFAEYIPFELNVNQRNHSISSSSSTNCCLFSMTKMFFFLLLRSICASPKEYEPRRNMITSIQKLRLWNMLCTNNMDEIKHRITTTMKIDEEQLAERISNGTQQSLSNLSGSNHNQTISTLPLHNKSVYCI